jgi:porphobilinogen synthase
MMHVTKPTRLRGNKQIRDLIRETVLSMNDVIYPIFVVEGENIREEISSMKDQFHLSIDRLEEEVKKLKALGIRYLLLFGTPDHKDEIASSAYEDNGVVQRAIKAIKAYDKEMYVIPDICLCQYKSDGHCCIFDHKGNIEREKTVDLLGKIALSHAKAGADMVAPSDMMDGRIGHLRKILDKEGYEHIPIMAYSAKYASSFYGPFREAAHSAPAFGDRKAYQMDPGNSKEAVKEMMLDLEEGADILMVKPAMPYLDIIRRAKENFHVPIAAYQVSGEYAMLRNAVDTGVLDKRAIYESLLGIKRSGADIIITYFAKELKQILEEEQK